MKRGSVNFLVDTAAFIAFLFLATTGVLMRYTLPPGSGGSKAVWGMTRHDWGSWHFWTAVVFLALISLHLFLHWRWILAVVQGPEKTTARMRLAYGLVGLVALFALTLAPLLLPVEQGSFASRGHEGEEHGPGGGMGRRGGRGAEAHSPALTAAAAPNATDSSAETAAPTATTTPATASGVASASAPPERSGHAEGHWPGPDGRPALRGFTTLAEAAQRVGQTPQQVIEKLQLLPTTAPTSRLRDIADAQGWAMPDLRDKIEQLAGEKK